MKGRRQSDFNPHATRDRRGGQSFDPAVWEAFTQAKSADVFCRAWLAMVCSQLPTARAAAVLVEGVQAHTFVPIAVWPQAAPDMARLASAVEKALSEKRGVVQPDTVDGVRFTHLAYPVMVGERVAGVVAVDMGGVDAQVQAALRSIHWASAWLSNMFSKREMDLAMEGTQRVGSVLEVMAVALRHGKFQQALFEVTNELRQRFGASRVAIGLAEHAQVKVAALSEAATFEKRTPIVKAYARAMEEAFDHGKPVCVSALDRSDDAVVNKAESFAQHMALLVESGDTDVLSYPLFLGTQCRGVLVIERSRDDGFTPADVAWLDAFAVLLAPVMEQRIAAERSALKRLSSEAQGALSKLFGPRHLVWKASASLAALAVVMLVLVPIDYRVSAKTVIEGEVQRVVAAPFEGFIGASFVRAGDTVTKGQMLAQLDDRDLKIEQVRWASERDQYDNKLREAMANADMSSIQVLTAQLNQSQAQLALVTEKLERARMVAPFDGVVVSGDLSQQISSPVESGKKLFEVAPLERYRVILQVDEREIRHVRQGQVGHIVITGIASDPMPLSVVKVTPVATAQDGKNFFRVEASLDRVPDRLRPGMEGVGKIEVGSRRLWWVLTHSFTDWLTLTLWTWMP